MLSLLIIDDTPEKIQEIKKVILDNFTEIKECYIEDVMCTTEGLNKLCKNQYDLVLLDLNIPKIKDGFPSPNNSLEFLDIITEMDNINFPAHILGITRMDHIEEIYKKDFEDKLWSLMRYGEDFNGWENKLIKKIRYLITAKRQLMINPKYDYDVAVINALQFPEQKWLKRVFGEENWNEVVIPTDKYNTYYEKTITLSNNKSCRMLITFQHQMASTASASLTTKVIYNFRPKYLFMTGIAAGVDAEDVKLGDVLVASEVWDGSSGKYKDIKVPNTHKETNNIQSCFLPDPRHIAIDVALLNIVNKLKEREDMKNAITNEYKKYDSKGRPPISIHVGPMASVPAVIASESPLSLLQKQSRKLIGIEMESYGMFYAANNSINPRPKFFGSFKSASDYATKEKGDDYQDYASYTSAAFLKYIIENELEF